MFCLDFAFAFIVHGLIVKWSHSEHRFLQSSSRSPISLSNIHFTKLALTFGLGGIAGFGSAVALYPFDIVRMSVLEKGSSHFAYSTIPYMSVYLGSYFMLRDERSSFGSKFLLANISATLAAFAELPFDNAKLSISGGSTRIALATTAMRVPLAGLLLVSYDTILTSKTLRDMDNKTVRDAKSNAA